MKTIKWKTNIPNFEYHNEINPLLSTWQGHMIFGYDLVCNIEPKVIVELGVQSGYSLLSFAQAIKDRNLKTRIIGVDTWEGDKHTHKYDPNTLNKLKEIISKYYPDVNIELRQELFNDARKKLDGISIDILHIDGLHTLEAVKNDFELWSPLLSEDAFILFHDTKEIHDDFGVYLYWNDLIKSNKYSYIDFEHSSGLGVLFNKNLQLIPEFNWKDYYQIASEMMSYKKLCTYKDTEINNNNENLKQLIDEAEKLTNSNKGLSNEIEKLRNSNEYLLSYINEIRKRKSIRIINRLLRIFGKVLV